jgi:hypothetical protein
LNDTTTRPQRHSHNSHNHATTNGPHWQCSPHTPLPPTPTNGARVATSQPQRPQTCREHKGRRGQGVVMQTRREFQVRFFSFISYYTCTKYYLQKHTPHTPLRMVPTGSAPHTHYYQRTGLESQRPQTRCEHKGRIGQGLVTQTPHESQVCFFYFISYYTCSTNYYLQKHTPHTPP